MDMYEQKEIAFLKERLSYNPKTGTLTWLPVKEINGYKKRWNKQYAYKVAGSVGNCGYTVIHLNGKLYSAHRVAWAVYFGESPELDIDHANRDKTDNSIENLRLATRSQNNINSKIRKDSKSGFKGVHLHKQSNKWRAVIKKDKKNIHLD